MSKRQSRRRQRQLERELFGPLPREPKARERRQRLQNRTGSPLGVGCPICPAVAGAPCRNQEEGHYHLARTDRAQGGTPLDPPGTPGSCWACGNCCYPAYTPWTCTRCGATYPADTASAACPDCGKVSTWNRVECTPEATVRAHRCKCGKKWSVTWPPEPAEFFVIGGQA